MIFCIEVYYNRQRPHSNILVLKYGEDRLDPGIVLCVKMILEYSV
jgi:hypothetical protein